MSEATQQPPTSDVVTDQDNGRCAPAVGSAKFKVGDIVEATAKIWRKDGRSELQCGDHAKVREVFQATPESPQIIGLEIEGKLPIGDIVCFENVPLRIVYSPNAPGERPEKQP